MSHRALQVNTCLISEGRHPEDIVIYGHEKLVTQSVEIYLYNHQTTTAPRYITFIIFVI